MPTWVPFDNYKLRQVNGSPVDHDTDVIKLMLITAARAPVKATDVFKSDLGANEVAGTNYTPRGTDPGARTVTLATGVVTFDGGNVTWLQNAAGFTNARYGILYKDTGVDATSALIAYLDFVTDKGNVAGDLTIEMDVAGIITWT